MTKSDQKLSALFLVMDIFLLSICYFSSSLITRGIFDIKNNIAMFSISIFLWINIAFYRRLYHIHLHNGFKVRYKNFLKTFILFTASISFIYLFFNISASKREMLMYFLVSFLLLFSISNLILIKYIRHLRESGKNIRYLLVVGVGKNAKYIINYFESNPDLGYRILGCIETSQEDSVLGTDRILGKLDDLSSYIQGLRRVDEIIIALPFNSSEKIQKVIEISDYYGKRVKYIPDYVGLLGRNFRVTAYGEIPVINVRQTQLDMLQSSLLKRVFDVIFSFLVLLMLSPLYLIIAILIKIESKGPVFYMPIRVGRDGQEFKMFKFRSMKKNDSVYGGTKSTQKNDPRITGIGNFIRKTSLDELPQFINVLIGDMSVVGPRPHRSHLDNQLQSQVQNYMLRHYLKPGITGWAQVNGWRGPTETEEQRSQRTAHDLYYLENWSFLLDVKIIWLTIFGKKTHQTAY